MPKLLKGSNNRMLRLASCRIAAKVEGETCHLCGDGTCTLCGALGIEGDPGYLPALVCPDVTGMNATVAGITLADEIDTGANGIFDLTWSGSASGTWCLYNTPGQCGREFVSKTKIVTATASQGGNVAGTIDFYLYVRFVCTGGDMQASDGGYAFIEAYITGHGLISDNPVDATIFTTKNDIGGTSTHLPRARDCTLAGYELDNAATVTGFGAPLEAIATVGTGGTVTTGAACTNANCQTACVTTGITVTVSGGPAAGVSLDLDLVPGTCGYASAPGAYTATIGASVAPTAGYGLPPTFQLNVRDSTNALLFQGALACDGASDPVLGTYTSLTGDGATAVAA